MRKSKQIISIFALLACMLLSQEIRAEKDIPPHHPYIHYVGRVDMSNNDTVRYDWPGVALMCNFSGRSIGIKLNGGAATHFNLFLDGELIDVIMAPQDTIITVRPTQHKKIHELKLIKRTEADMGMVQFMGFVMEDKGMLHPTSNPLTRRIEFIGNSITCGYGTEGKDRNEIFKPETENNYKSYAAILSRAFNAEAHFIAHSGVGLVRNYGDENPATAKEKTILGRFGRTLDNGPDTSWDFSRWKPDCVIINLGTNDFSTTPHPDKFTFLKGYKELLDSVRQKYGKIPVFCVVGPMIDEPCFSYVKEFTRYCRWGQKDDQVFFVGMPDNLLNNHDDLGSDWHPSYKGQQKIAKLLLTPVASVMNWEYQEIIVDSILKLKESN